MAALGNTLGKQILKTKKIKLDQAPSKTETMRRKKHKQTTMEIKTRRFFQGRQEMGVLLHWTQANSFELVVRQNHGRRQGVKTDIGPFLEIGTKNQYFLEKLTSAAQFR